MSYRRLDNIDEKIIDATIVVGSQNGANKLSTKEIAKVCAISEFVIYDHFKSKENLVSMADRKIAALFGEKAEELIGQKVTFEYFWNSLVDNCLKNPAMTSFSINYGHIFPRTAKPEDYDSFLLDVITPVAKRCLSAFGVVLNRDVDYCYLWMWIWRTIVSYAQFVLGGSLVDTPEMRSLSYTVAYSGVKQLHKN
jgi:AcrR family transcriptional regulator